MNQLEAFDKAIAEVERTKKPHAVVQALPGELQRGYYVEPYSHAIPMEQIVVVYYHSKPPVKFCDVT